MHKKSGVGVRVSLSLCRAINDIEEVKALARLLHKEGVLPAEGTQPNVKTVGQQDIDTFVEKRRQDMTIIKGVLCDYPFPVVVKNWEPFRCFFVCRFNDKGVSVSFNGSVNKRWIGERNPIEYIELFAQEVLRVAKLIYETVQPTYGYIDDPLSVEYPGSDLQRAIDRELITLNWANFFGPEYVEQYGRDFLLNIPGWETKCLLDGGIFYQSRSSFVVEDKDAHREWQKRVKEHFAAVDANISFSFLRP